MKMKTKQLGNLNREGFLFNSYSFPKNFKTKVLTESEPSLETISIIQNILEEFNLPIDNTKIDFEDVILGESNELHTHLIPADCQMLIWVPLDEEYTGRDFLYKKKGQEIRRFKPKLGDICFMKTNDLDFLHGVSKLESDSRIRTIVVSVNCHQTSSEAITLNERLEVI